MCRQFQVHDVIGDARHGSPPNDQVCGQPVGPENPREASLRSDQSDQWWRRRRPVTRHPSALGEPRTTGWRDGTRRLRHRRSGRQGSPLAKLGFGAAAYVVPCHPAGLVSQRSPGSPLDLGGPCSFDVGLMVVAHVDRLCKGTARPICVILLGFWDRVTRRVAVSAAPITRPDRDSRDSQPSAFAGAGALAPSWL
jgi:hypothetical protein